MVAGLARARGGPAPYTSTAVRAAMSDEREFLPLRIAVLTVSDSRTAADDRAGDLLAERLQAAGHALADRALAPDDIYAVRARVSAWLVDPGVQVILTTGGTGVTGRDVTPEAFHEVYEREIPGFGELFRQLSYDLIGTSTMQSRATGGVAAGTYLFALPGSPGACKDGWDKILRHQLDYRWRPCNLVELMPRLRETERRGEARGNEGGARRNEGG